MTDPIPRQETEVEAAWTRVWRTLLIRGIILVLVVAALGMGIGWLVSGMTGLVGGAVGGGLAAVFIIITLVIMYLGRNMGLTAIAGFLGIGFLFRAFIIMIVIWRIKDATLLAHILRDGRHIVPRGDDVIRPGDRVLVVTTLKQLTRLEDIFLSPREAASER